jgi:hypothetical protein
MGVSIFLEVAVGVVCVQGEVISDELNFLLG